jgi:hypothetical protein
MSQKKRRGRSPQITTVVYVLLLTLCLVNRVAPLLHQIAQLS